MNEHQLNTLSRMIREDNDWEVGQENFVHGLAAVGILGIIIAIIAKFMGNNTSSGGSGSSRASGAEIEAAITGIETSSATVQELAAEVAHDLSTFDHDKLEALRTSHQYVTLVNTLKVMSGDEARWGAENVPVKTLIQACHKAKSEPLTWWAEDNTTLPSTFRTPMVLGDYTVCSDIRHLFATLTGTSKLIEESLDKYAAIVKNPSDTQAGKVTEAVQSEIDAVNQANAEILKRLSSNSKYQTLDSVVVRVREAFTPMQTVDVKALTVQRLRYLYDTADFIATTVTAFEPTFAKLEDIAKLAKANKTVVAKGLTSAYLNPVKALVSIVCGADLKLGSFAKHVDHFKANYESLDKHLEAFIKHYKDNA